MPRLATPSVVILLERKYPSVYTVVSHWRKCTRLAENICRMVIHPSGWCAVWQAHLYRKRNHFRYYKRGHVSRLPIGYAIAFVVVVVVVFRWHLGFCKEACLPNNRGFDSFYGFYSGTVDHLRYVYGKSDSVQLVLSWVQREQLQLPGCVTG